MIKKTDILFIFWIFISAIPLANAAVITAENKEFFDESRHRKIPVIVYLDKTLKADKKTHATGWPVVIINHGYTIKNSEYAFLANRLAANGYLVISIQHDLATDAPLAKTGNLYNRRMPLWERGVQTIHYVINNLKQIEQNIDTQSITLIGHSNGGDISMLFATKYPELVHNIISLDSLRMPFPKKKGVRILSLRANDTTADDHVLPGKSAQKKYNIKIVSLKNAKHIDMCDRGSEEVKRDINIISIDFINNK